MCVVVGQSSWAQLKAKTKIMAAVVGVFSWSPLAILMVLQRGIDFVYLDAHTSPDLKKKIMKT